MGKDQENADSRKARTRRILRVSAHAIRDYFTQCKESVFTQHELFALLASKKAEWQLGKSITRQDFLTVLQQRVPLKQLVLKSAKYPSVIRMVRGNPSCFEIGLSLRKGAYISHASAAYLHDLLDTLTVLYINKEQTPKDQSLELTQAGIDTAFARSPRESTLRYRSSDPSDEIEYVLLNGKSTDCLGVVWLTKPDIGRVPGPNTAAEREWYSKPLRKLVKEESSRVGRSPSFCEKLSMAIRITRLSAFSWTAQDFRRTTRGYLKHRG